jgi:ferric enterobactin receptor
MNSLEFEAGYSRQGNLYAGDTQNTNTNDLVKKTTAKRPTVSIARPTR